MRRIRSTARLLFLGSLALTALSCGASAPSRDSGSGQSREVEAVENSGKRISGEFVLISLEDSFRQDNPQSQATFNFDEDGDFKRQDRSRLEEGTYLISVQNELMLYVEKMNGEPLPAARLERYQIADQSDTGFTLQEGPTRKLVLRKR